MKEYKKDGKWKVNKGRLLFIVVPTGYLAFYVFIYFYIHFLSLPHTISLYLMNQDSSQVSEILFGYFLITSFRKELNVESINKDA